MDNEELVQKVVELEARVKELEQSRTLNSSVSDVSNSRREKISVTEFLRERNPETAMDKALVFAKFFEKDSGSETFVTGDLLTLWRQAKEALPSNVNDLIAKNVKKGLMAEETVKKDGKKCWYVTRSGVAVVDKGFQS